MSLNYTGCTIAINSNTKEIASVFSSPDEDDHIKQGARLAFESLLNSEEFKQLTEKDFRGTLDLKLTWAAHLSMPRY